MLAGTATIEITPDEPVWMDGMIRSHPSVGVHDPLHARALVLGGSVAPEGMFAVVSVDVCALRAEDCNAARRAAEEATGIPARQVIIAATHTHAGPATFGFFNPAEPEYTRDLMNRLAGLIGDAAARLQPVAIGCDSGSENTISHYRRLLADDGRVVMNWEPFPAERIVAPLGAPDPEVGALKIVARDDPLQVLALMFNHAGHPNVMTGDNYLLSAEYPGAAVRRVEEAWGGTAMFVNGAQGSVDIDGRVLSGWEGVERAGMTLAAAVSDIVCDLAVAEDARLRGGVVAYAVPTRRITDEEWAWASGILRATGGKVQPVADGVGDDYKATLYHELRHLERREEMIEQTCFALDDAAFITFPGELYTEIGLQVKAMSPFRRTYIIGLANGNIGYVPTRKAIGEGGYAEDTRRLDASAGDTVLERSLALLGRLNESST